MRSFAIVGVRAMRSRPFLYRLVGRLPVPVADSDIGVELWARDMAHSRIVRQDNVGPLFVSTVFLGCDHNHSGTGDPLLFETMIFDGQLPIGDSVGYQQRYHTWDEAERGHEDALAHARASLAAADEALKPKE